VAPAAAVVLPGDDSEFDRSVKLLADSLRRAALQLS
jgi:hypothetical protein